MLSPLFITACLSLLLITATAAGAPKNCNAITATTVDKSFTYNSAIYSSLDLKLFKFGNTTWIHVSHFYYNDGDGEGEKNVGTEKSTDYFCVNHNFGISQPDPQICSQSYNGTFSFSLQETYFYLHTHLSGNWYELYSGFADDGTFSFNDGTLFTPEEPSITSGYADYKGSRYVTQNCTSFTAAPEAIIKAPKCKSFESQTVVLNSDNSTYANATAVYSFTNALQVHRKYPNDCKWELFEGDGKVIIDSHIVKFKGSEYTGVAVPLIGRIIIRGNETLMSEGIPYTPSKACLYSSFGYGDGKISNNKMCCTEFEQA
uniref:Uncharacterized protein n=1 Tax=Panagrolaimus davidi TaxID=227884 RepID=A0A914Q2X6_9BILA